MDERVILERAREYVEMEGHEGFRKEVEDLLAGGKMAELEERFYTDLSFGTGGIRGIMGGGFNRINPLVIQRTTQGLANYIIKQNIDQPSVAIGHDSRHNSPLFARTAAAVLAANNIRVHLFSALRPTPELSFALRELGCTSGIVCTASHNPKIYNGYKVYWQDGAQIVQPQDAGIIAEVKAVGSSLRSMDPDEAVRKGLIKYIGTEMDDDFLEMTHRKIIRSELFPPAGKPKLKIVYTPLHGTGAILMERLCRELDIPLRVVPEQREPDGDFPTVKFPNPEEPTAMEMALELARKEEADLVIGTDPDADRIGVAIRHGGEYLLLNGNQHGVLLCDYVFGSMKEQGSLPPRPAFVNTIVSTDLQRKIARKYGAEVHETLTGFKWIASKIREFEQNNGPEYVLGGEESYGFMIGTNVRDKDSIGASLVTIEMALYYQQQGKTLHDRLDEIHQEFGLYQESLISKNFEGVNGADIMEAMMADLRRNPPKAIGGIGVEVMRDILDGTSLQIASNRKEKDVDIPSSNVLQFFLADGSVLSARPSGTEPKIKFYASVKDDPGREGSRERLEKKLQAIEGYIESVIAGAGSLQAGR